MRHTILFTLPFVMLGRTLAAQTHWSATFERGFTTFSQAAHDTSTPQIHLVPWHPALYTLRVARDGDRLGAALGVGYSNGDLAGTVEDLVVLPGAKITLLELAPEVRLRLVTTSTGARLVAHAGPIFDLWTPAGDNTRSTFGGMAGGTLAVPITSRWEMEVRMDYAITGSEVTKAEESDELIRARTMRRGRLALGITRTL